MMHFKALLIDAYRQLSAAKLFWLTVGLSVIVVILFGSIGFNTQGVTFLFGAWETESELLNAGSPWARGLYIGIYSSFLVNIWLAWIATVLALISTCSIFPEFVHSGSIELTISKPIGRLQLFFSKYLVSLLFVVLQVSIFCVGIFLCVGFRVDEWNPLIFTAIPIVAVFYSYLFSVCVLVGMLTRSGITALLVTGVFWMGLWSVQTTEVILNSIVIAQHVDIERFEEGIVKSELALAKIEEKSPDDSRIETRRKRIERYQADVEEAKEILSTLEKWNTPITWLLTISPKAGQTIGLLDRWLSDPDGFDIGAILNGDMRAFDTENMEEFDPTTSGVRDRKTSRRIREDYESRSLWYVLGTSLLFEGCVLGIAAWYFCRKDF